MRIGALDQVYFPRTRPLLHGLFTLNRLFGRREGLEPNESVYAILPREAGRCSGPVLMHSANEAIGDPDVERSARSAGENIRVVGAHFGPQIRWQRLWHVGSRAQGPG